ncbi:lipopolysaccharide biosynthesis protein [Agreia sp.]|uniref:lipopolysaccharide biosynthesis protein n=1 Tax=Agreia sp. TaxID=1872416 RepID=UPI0035BC2EDC
MLTGEVKNQSAPSVAHGVRWSGIAVIARQLVQVLSAVLIARILGPSSYGIISAAMIYVTLTSLVLDQGLSAALIQRPKLNEKAPGAVATVNILLAVIIAVVTWFAAPLLAGFFGTPELVPVFRMLAVLLPLKALAIVPRAMLSRGQSFKGIALADVAGGIAGATTGVTAAMLGADFFSLIYQVGVTDAIVAVMMLVFARGPVPNFAFAQMKNLMSFSVKVFLTNCVAYFSRNVDGILVGRVLGVTSLAMYGMAYRVLSLPVQFVGQTVNRVLFPVFSRNTHDRAKVATQLTGATETLALAVVPVMVFISCAAPELVRLVLGPEWLPAAALIAVFALGGARETIFYITPALMKAFGRTTLLLNYEFLATGLQVAGIIVGLQFGVFGVAVGYTAVGFALIPVLLGIQARISGVRVRTQLAAILPAVHASAWGAAAYLCVGLLDLPLIAHLAVGAAAYVVLALAVLLVVHRRMTIRFIGRAGEILGSRRATPDPRESAAPSVSTEEVVR